MVCCARQLESVVLYVYNYSIQCSLLLVLLSLLKNYNLRALIIVLQVLLLTHVGKHFSQLTSQCFVTFLGKQRVFQWLWDTLLPIPCTVGAALSCDPHMPPGGVSEPVPVGPQASEDVSGQVSPSNIKKRILTRLQHAMTSVFGTNSTHTCTSFQNWTQCA